MLVDFKKQTLNSFNNTNIITLAFYHSECTTNLFQVDTNNMSPQSISVSTSLVIKVMHTWTVLCITLYYIVFLSKYFPTSPCSWLFKDCLISLVLRFWSDQRILPYTVISPFLCKKCHPSFLTNIGKSDNKAIISDKIIESVRHAIVSHDIALLEIGTKKTIYMKYFEVTSCIIRTHRIYLV